MALLDIPPNERTEGGDGVVTDRERIDGLLKIAGFFEARADMAVGDAKMLLLNWMKCAQEAAEALKKQTPKVLALDDIQ